MSRGSEARTELSVRVGRLYRAALAAVAAAETLGGGGELVQDNPWCDGYRQARDEARGILRELERAVEEFDLWLKEAEAGKDS
jgi:hypothetical protein